MLDGSYQPLCETSGQTIEVRIGPMGAGRCILAVDTLRSNKVVVLTEHDVNDLKSKGRWAY